MEGVIFDLDGTLANTALLHKKAWEIALNRIGEKPTFDITILLGRKTIDIAKILIGEDRADTLASLKTEIYNSLIKEEAKPTECAKELVNKLKDNGIKVAVVTSSKRISAEEVLRIIEISPHTLVTNDDVNMGKPHPEPVLKALNIMKVKPTNVIGIGDTAYDIIAYNSAGLNKSFLLRGDVPLNKELLSSFTYHEIDSLCDLITTSRI
jgi:HAD superfamily hydrolase (TIGR01509 family)